MFRVTKRFGAFAFVCLFASAALASVTISGNLKDLTGTAVASRTFVRFTIRGCNGNQPRKAGTAIIVPSIYEFTPNGSGAISGTLYDSLTDIECGGVVGATWYGVTIFRDGKPNPEVAYNVTGATFNLNSALPNTTNPVVAAPTGDSTYARLDGLNQPFTGNITAPSFIGSLTGNASTATALAANGTNCTAGNYPLGVDASGNVENCTSASGGGVTSIATTSPITGGTITTTGTIAINDAAADGSTKGAASFTAADFNASGGLISLDYTNGQKATGSVPGFLSSTDWTTFNGKQSAIAGNTLAANNFATSINSAGTISGAQPSAANLSNGTTGSGAVVLVSAPALTNPIVGTQSASDNSTKAASTAYVDRIGPGGSGAAITFWAPNGTVASNTSVVAANVVRLAHFWLSNTVAFNTIGVQNVTADGVNSYSFGVFSLDGTVRYAHTTAQTMVGSGTFRALAVAEGTVTLAPGDYLFAWTGAATTATFLTLGSGVGTRLAPSSSSTVTASGVMPAAPINVPALSPVQAAVGIISFILYQ